MSFELQDVSRTDREAFAHVVRCMWDTYENPVQPLFYIFCPLNAVGASNREEAIKETTDRFWDWYVSDPDAQWQKVIETETGRVIGGTYWRIHKTNPYAEPQDEDAYWHPKGSQRDYANQVLEAHEAARSQLATRPHVYLNIIFTHPDYQRRGIGRILMDWGVAKAAELDMEMWLNAWRYGKVLYEKYGFITVEHHAAKPKTDNADEVWRKCERDWNDLEEWVMWRPRGGPYIEGQSVKPWL